jgi:hypothetical protein
MTKTSLFVAMLVVGVAGAAEAGGQAGSLGVGAEAQITGVGGASVNYDAGDFHIGGFLGFHDPGDRDDDTFVFGGRFLYHVHQTTTSDFSVGGTVGLASENNPAPVDRETKLYIEPAIQIRAFITQNVALSFNVGVTIGVMDAENVDLGGQQVGTSANGEGANLSLGAGAGVHYYFF